jgi:oleandomycin transport system permease protein
MNGIAAIFYRDYRQRMTNIAFLFWDLFAPLAYLTLFGLGFQRMIGDAPVVGDNIGYIAFLVPGVLAMLTFSIAMNTSWGFFMDKESGIFYELLTYPITRQQILIGKISFNVLLSVIGSALVLVLGAVAFDTQVRWDLLPLTVLLMIVTRSTRSPARRTSC